MKMIFTPHLVDDFEPLRGTRISIIMRLELHTIFPGFVGPPGRNDVKREPTALANVILGLNKTGKRRSCAALDISFGLLPTMERRYRRPNLSNSESCSDFDVSIMNDLCPFTTGTPKRSR